jgi:membrane fusion protein (multidrug efflux system)
MSVYTTVNTRDGAADADNEADLDASPMLHPK